MEDLDVGYKRIKERNYFSTWTCCISPRIKEISSYERILKPVVVGEGGFEGCQLTATLRMM
jgi:hypothetical protein